MNIEWEGTPGKHLEGANITVAPGVIVELATLNDDQPYGWGVWGVRIDGVLYREPRNLNPEPMHDTPFRRLIEEHLESAVTAATKDQR